MTYWEAGDALSCTVDWAWVLGGLSVKFVMAAIVVLLLVALVREFRHK
jgi:membrane protein implicated in regulation of membrane protease activity